GLLLTTQAATKHLGQGGSIINIGSLVSRITPPASAVYTATKSAVEGITGALARELGPRGIRVNALNPGLVETEGTHSAGCIGQPQDIASIAVFLASDDAGWLTGEKLYASGGLR